MSPERSLMPPAVGWTLHSLKATDHLLMDK